MLRDAQQPDMDWDWAYTLRLATSERRYEAEIDKLAHGVLLLETEWHRSQLDSQGVERSPLVYVEYLASVPWNRRVIEDPPYFVGIGRTLLLFARQRSVEVGYDGRVGLPQYQRQKLSTTDRECQTMGPTQIKMDWYTLSTVLCASEGLKTWTIDNSLSSLGKQAT